MTRQRTTEDVPVPAHTMQVESFTVTCDKCGAAYRAHDHCTNEIIIAMDEGECVSFAHRRDYCAPCAAGVWEAVCAVIRADPDEPGRTGFGDG